LWIFNSAALDILRENDAELVAMERYDGRLTGRLYDGDEWLRIALASRPPALGRASALLASYGITGVSDASVDNDRMRFAHFRDAQDAGELLQALRVMGDSSLTRVATRTDLGVGPVKFHLHDDALPELHDLSEKFFAAHADARGVAVHCVTLSELVLTLAALREAGATPSDRIEHLAICPPDFYPILAELSVTVVTNPNFVAERGDSYLRDVAADERAWLYPARTIQRAGVTIAGGCDAPFGAPDPWAAMQAAVDRKTSAGAVIGEEECLSPEEALALFLTPLEDPGGPARCIKAGVTADLCLLDRPWARARHDLSAVRVVLVLRRGTPIWRA
jgi:predicted amidohydrolase YtcJ